MSTRCQIGIYEKDFSEKTKADAVKLSKAIQNKAEVLLYRHSDGYPGAIGEGDEGKDGVIPDILPFVRAFVEKRGYEVEYLGACLTAYLKYWHCGEKSNNKLDNYNVIINGFKVFTLDHGICKYIHLDIAYFYAITPTCIKVYKKSGGWDNEPFVFTEIESHEIGVEPYKSVGIQVRI